MSDEIRWENPPEYVRIIGSGNSPGRHAKFAQILKDHPGKWAILPEAGVKTEASAMAKAQNIRRGKVKGFEANQFESAADGLTIYVRFVGSPDGEPKNEESADSEEEEADPEEWEPPDDAGPVQPTGPAPSANMIRRWARSQGLIVTDRGRLPRDVVEKYHIAMSRRAHIRAVEH